MLCPGSCLNRREKSYHEARRRRWRWAVRGVRLPFFGFALLHSASPPSLSSFSSRSFQRRTCSCRIFKNRVFFCSSLRASSTSGSMYMSFKICCSILAAGRTWPSGSKRGGAVLWPATSRTCAGLQSHVMRKAGLPLLVSSSKVTLNHTHKLFFVKPGACPLRFCTYRTITRIQSNKIPFPSYALPTVSPPC